MLLSRTSAVAHVSALTNRPTERGVGLGNKLWVREIRWLSSNAHQTAVSSTDFQSDRVQIARQMFSRWALENWFKQMIEYFFSSCQPEWNGRTAASNFGWPSPPATYFPV